MKAMTKEWIKAAYDDLMAIQELVDNSHLTHIVAFHAQQCVEKLLKAVLEEHEIETPKIHKLVELQTIMPNQTINLDNDMLALLDKLYIDSRYPSDFGLLPNGKPSSADANMFYEFAQNTLYSICQLLDMDIKEIQ